MNLKVGVMPGRLVEVVVENGTTAREIFEIANVEVSNHEIRLDGNKIGLDDTIERGNLLVAMKMIKGNAQIKVGIMPGRLTNVDLLEGDRAMDIFNRAGIEISNHEIRLDGNKIDLDTAINNGNLLVAMKMIKGNVEKYVTDLSLDEVKNLTFLDLDTEIDKSDVEFVDGIVMIGDTILEEDMFHSIYRLEEQDVFEVRQFDEPELDIKEVKENCDCTHVKAIEVIDKELKALQENYDYHMNKVIELDKQLILLKRIKNEVQG